MLHRQDIIESRIYRELKAAAPAITAPVTIREPDGSHFQYSIAAAQHRQDYLLRMQARAEAGRLGEMV